MDIAISGASGLIGSALSNALTDDGHRSIALVRRAPVGGADEIRWDPAGGEIDEAALEGIDAVVNLSGAGIGDRRWTPEYREVLVASRTRSTALLAATVAGLNRAPSVFLSASAIGFYGSRGSEELIETSPPGTGFLPQLCIDWEASSQAAVDAGIRTVQMRTGIVLSPAGGALGKLLPLFKFGLGGKFGDGGQYMSWISIDDMVGAMSHLLTADVHGPVNMTAPEPSTNARFVATLGDVLGRPAMLPVPKFGPAMILGRDRADALLFDSARVIPTVLASSGYTFAHPDLQTGLRAVLQK